MVYNTAKERSFTMNTKNITASQRKALIVATIIALLFIAYFLRSYFTMFVLAGVIGYTFSPVYRRLLKKFSRSSAAMLTLLIAFFSVVVPISIVIALCVSQLSHLVDVASETLSNTDLSKLGNEVVGFANDILASIPFVSYTLTEQSIMSGVSEAAQNVGSWVLQQLTGSLSGFFSILTNSIIFIYVFLSLLVNHEKLVALFKKLNPLGDDISNMYLQKTAAMVRGTVGGQFIIAFAQGIFGAITIYIAGVHEAFFVFVLVLSLLSIIPLGSGIISIPIGIVMMLFGNILGGLLVVLGHIIVVTNIDNILRPRLVPKEARLDSALMLVSVFAGIAMFGFLGIIIGPVLMILAVTTIQTYVNLEKPKSPKMPKPTRA